MEPKTATVFTKSRISTLRTTMVVLIAWFGLCDLLAVMEIRRAQASSRLIVDNMLVSIESVEHVIRDMEQKRILLVSHIFEIRPQEMESLEQKLATLDADIIATAKAYEAYVIHPEERAAWEQLRAQDVALGPLTEEILGKSRRNEDLDAFSLLPRFNQHFSQLEQTADNLIRINHTEAGERDLEIHTIHRRVLIYILGITLTGIALSLFFTAWVTSVLVQRDAQIQRTALLEQRNRELDAFAGRVAHDLRGPMTTISLAATRLAGRVPQEEGTTAILRRGMAQMEQLIEDLLALSAVGTQVRDSVANMMAVVASLEDDLRPLVTQAEGTLTIEAQPGAVGCSPGLVRQMLWNLADNAVKYRRPDVPLALGIKGSVVGRYYQFRVSDNGMGLSAQDASHAFEPLYRGSKVGTIPGTGLGLSIVKRIVEACGGIASISSRPDHGTTVTIELPLKEPEKAVAPSN